MMNIPVHKIKFKYGNTEYQVFRIDELEGLDALRNTLINNDIEPRHYFAGQIFKNGQISDKQGAMFFRFNSGRFLMVETFKYEN